MTDRVNMLTVVLEQDIRTDDVEPLIAAIRQLKWVLDVRANVTDVADYMAISRVRSELSGKLWEILHGKSQQ